LRATSRVLVVDDVADFADMMTALVRASGYEAICVADPRRRRFASPR